MSKVQQFGENEDKLAYIFINGNVFVESLETDCKSRCCKKTIKVGQPLRITSDITAENVRVALDAMRGDFESTMACVSIEDHIDIIKFLRFLEVSDNFLLGYVRNIICDATDFIQQCSHIPHDNEMLFIIENAVLSIDNREDYIREILSKSSISNDLKVAILRRMNIRKKDTIKHNFKEDVAIIKRNGDSIPEGTTKVVFRYNFNGFIGNRYIPGTVLELIFGEHFNQPVFCCIPSNVVRLIFGKRFNQSIHECIPNSVEYLEFGEDFNQSIINCIPPSVKHIVFGKKFRQPLCLQFPLIEKITLHRDYNWTINKNLMHKIVWID